MHISVYKQLMYTVCKQKCNSAYNTVYDMYHKVCIPVYAALSQAAVRPPSEPSIRPPAGK